MDTGKRQKELQQILTRNFLYKKYIIEEKSLRDLSYITTAGITTICRYLQQFEIPVRKKRISRIKQKRCIDCNKTLCYSSSKGNSSRCKKCNYKFLSKENNANWQGGKQKLNCDYCNTVIYRNKATVQKHNFCCRKCYGLWKQNRFYFLCDVCGKKVERTKSNIGHHIFCSYRCVNKKVFRGIMIEYNKKYFRSSWEANFAKWCDLSGIKWEYEPKTFDLGNTTYTPDFYLPDFDLWIEVKGYWRADAKKKFKAFKKQYKDKIIKVFDKNKLELLGVI